MVVPQCAFPVAANVLVGRLLDDAAAQTGVHLGSRDPSLTHALPGVRLDENIRRVPRQLPDDAQHVCVVQRHLDRLRHGVIITGIQIARTLFV